MCSHGSSDVVEYLATKHQELINTTDEVNNNGLHLASIHGSLETVMYLIEKQKMDPTVNGSYGRNSFINACYGKLEIAKYLATKHPELINTVDKYDDNGLHLASRQGNLETVTVRSFGSKMGQRAYPMGFPSHPMGKMGMNQVWK